MDDELDGVSPMPDVPGAVDNVVPSLALTSWWICPAWEFAARCEAEQARMRESVFGRVSLFTIGLPVGKPTKMGKKHEL